MCFGGALEPRPDRSSRRPASIVACGRFAFARGVGNAPRASAGIGKRLVVGGVSSVRTLLKLMSTRNVLGYALLRSPRIESMRSTPIFAIST